MLILRSGHRPRPEGRKGDHIFGPHPHGAFTLWETQEAGHGRVGKDNPTVLNDGKAFAGLVEQAFEEGRVLSHSGNSGAWFLRLSGHSYGFAGYPQAWFVALPPLERAGCATTRQSRAGQAEQRERNHPCTHRPLGGVR